MHLCHANIQTLWNLLLAIIRERKIMEEKLEELSSSSEHFPNWNVNNFQCEHGCTDSMRDALRDMCKMLALMCAVYRKEQCLTNVYRLLPASGGILYVQTEASMLYESNAATGSATLVSLKQPLGAPTPDPSSAVASVAMSNGKTRPLGIVAL